MLLTNFQILRPQFESNQEDTLNWIVDAHVKAEGDENLRAPLKEKLWKVGCKPDRIEKRGHVFDDFSHNNWREMAVYCLNESPQGKNLSDRTRIFERESLKAFSFYYPENATPPDDLFQVSCTGYVSPSAAQMIVSQKGWGQTVTVTQIHHMGCYASIPAIRMAANTKHRADIVHTEICSLHSNPSNHNLDQLVSQSLFADGFIKYSLVKQTNKSCLRVIRLKEEVLPDCLDAMTWKVHSWGFEMGLAKEIPVFITRHLKSYLQRLCPDGIPPNAIYAIHPGGPKILTYIQNLLELKDSQIAYSFEILKKYGNMSSATLPHIWERILADPQIPESTQIISLAFGPGLTIAGAIMEKVCGS